jgi:hypothetical protein
MALPDRILHDTDGWRAFFAEKDPELYETFISLDTDAQTEILRQVIAELLPNRSGADD